MTGYLVSIKSLERLLQDVKKDNSQAQWIEFTLDDENLNQLIAEVPDGYGGCTIYDEEPVCCISAEKFNYTYQAQEDCNQCPFEVCPAVENCDLCPF